MKHGQLTRKELLENLLSCVQTDAENLQDSINEVLEHIDTMVSEDTAVVLQKTEELEMLKNLMVSFGRIGQALRGFQTL